MRVGELANRMAVDRLNMQFYIHIHPIWPYIQGIQVHLGNPGYMGLTPSLVPPVVATDPNFHNF